MPLLSFLQLIGGEYKLMWYVCRFHVFFVVYTYITVFHGVNGRWKLRLEGGCGQMSGGCLKLTGVEKDLSSYVKTRSAGDFFMLLFGRKSVVNCKCAHRHQIPSVLPRPTF